ncbi:Cu+-exporting ATPase [Pilibacter termitis]|uniref:P-type Cu(+) transporter n=1 Tax=Pilibacter termitis TaxID=263852 RepID=A0A1T4R5K0_9ENTE|nr:cation-translocating P-type ATPase [Pilibacter termitis]SKA11167.1 Cu+-exporting ATPase [Pilibacter termitis]
MAEVRNKKTFAITGMTCANCAARIHKGLSTLEGVSENNVNLATERATVILNERGTIEEVIGRITSLGYGAILYDKAHKESVKQARKKVYLKLKRDVLLGVIFTLPMFFSMLLMLFSLHVQTLMFLHLPITQFLLSTPVQFLLGARFYKGAYLALKNKSANMDVLVSLGTSVAYVSSIIFGLLLNQSSAVHFESSASILTLVTLGKFLEMRGKAKTGKAIEQLMNLQEKRVQVIQNGKIIEKEISEIQKGDCVQVLSGSSVAVDGKIIKGFSTLDESNLTGESVPVEKTVGELVYAGTSNLTGVLEIEVTEDSEDFLLTKIIDLVEESQGSKAEIQQLADKMSSIFVPIVLLIALLTFLLTWFLTNQVETSLLHATAVLVVACPCALGLATPTAIIVASGIAARLGIFIRDAQTMERMNEIDTIIFDKTGTLTQGKLSVENFSGKEENRKILASIERKSNHPIARAIAENYTGEILSVENVEEIAGSGLKATISGKQYFVGSENMMKTLGVSIPKETNTTSVYLTNGEEILSSVRLHDEIKPEAKTILQELVQMKKEVVLLSGDKRIVAEQTAELLNLSKENVYAEVLPDEKAEIVLSFQNQGKKVLMAGDGVNDAAALSIAEVGVAMGSGSDIAIESSDVTFLDGNLKKIIQLFYLSKRTLTKIRHNLFWSFIYNIIGIPIAAIGILTPTLAGTMMALSSVSVIISSLALRSKKY